MPLPIFVPLDSPPICRAHIACAQLSLAGIGQAAAEGASVLGELCVQDPLPSGALLRAVRLSCGVPREGLGGTLRGFEYRGTFLSAEAGPGLSLSPEGVELKAWRLSGALPSHVSLL